MLSEFSTLLLIFTATLPVVTARAHARSSASLIPRWNPGEVKLHPPETHQPPPQDEITCVAGLHIIIPTGHEGNTLSEPVETEDLIALAEDIKAAIPNSGTHTTWYPYCGLDTFGSYKVDVAEGATFLKEYIQKYVDACGSDSRIALLGYAQGALIASDAFVGSGVNQHTLDGYLKDFGNEKWSAGVRALQPEYANHIVAAAIFASPAAFWHEGYSRGTALSNGMFASTRGPLSVDPVKYRSWCDDGDFLCAAVAQGVPKGSHTMTVKHYREDAKRFVVDAWEKANEGGGLGGGLGGGDGGGNGRGDGSGDDDHEDDDCEGCIDVGDLGDGDDESQ